MSDPIKDALVETARRVAHPFMYDPYIQEHFEIEWCMIKDKWGGGVVVSFTQQERAVMVITGRPRTQVNNYPIREAAFEELFIDLLDKMSDEGDPLGEEEDDLYSRVLWLLARVEQNRLDGRNKVNDCGLPPHRLLQPSPYHNEVAIEVVDPQWGPFIFTFFFP